MKTSPAGIARLRNTVARPNGPWYSRMTRLNFSRSLLSWTFVSFMFEMSRNHVEPATIAHVSFELPPWSYTCCHTLPM